MPNPFDLRRTIADQFAAVVGPHDEPEVFGGPAGDPGLCGPGSMSWEINGSMGAVAAAGSAAIVMELLHPSVMAGVHDHSTVREDPLRRARTTMGYVLVTTFGSTDAAESLIAKVKRIHEFVEGTRPDGVPYRALDPDLIAWVHTAIPWAILESYDRYVRPLSTAEKDRYLAEQSVIGVLGGATSVPTTYAELGDYVEAMRPQLAVGEQLRSFLDFLLGDGQGSWRERYDARLALHASMSLMPAWARRLTGFDHPALVQRLWVEPNARLQVKLLDWAIGEPACLRLARERAAGVGTTTAPVAA